MSLSRNTACRRLSSLGLKQELVHSLIDTVSRWERNEGVEHTIARLKKLKLAFINRLAGHKPDLSWIAHKNNLPKGPFGRVFLLRKPQKALSALMIYTSYVSSDITDKQKAKFFDSVSKSEPVDTKLFTLFERVKLDSVEPTPLYEFPITGNVPNIRGLGSIKDPDHSCVRSVRRMDWVESHVLANRDRYVKSGFHHVGEVITLHMKDFLNPLPMGRIGFIQEPGYKLRAVANPHRGLQYLLDPLKRSLLKKLRQSVNDCTFDQEKGVLWSQEMLKEGFSLSSVDLSDATNTFPLSAQLELLRNSFQSQPWMLSLVDIFEEASTRPWATHEWWGEDSSGSLRTLTWSKGQPLGLAPSFPSFALCHHLVMKKVIEEVDGLPARESLFMDNFLSQPHGYKILGDDIVMLSRYENTYKRIMTHDLGCNVAEDKTITSNVLAEFASRVIRPSEILVQNKWRQTSDHNFLALAKNLGPNSLCLLRPRQRRVVKALCSLPESHGGLGWNPEGIPLSIRQAAAPFILQRIKETVVHRKDIQASSNFWRDPREISQGLILSNEGWTLRLNHEGEIEEVRRPARSTADFLRSSFRFITEKVRGDEVPDGYTLMDVTSDPRGTPVLLDVESRLGLPPQIVTWEDSDESSLEKLVFLEEHIEEVAQVIHKSGVSKAPSIQEQQSKVSEVIEQTFRDLSL